MKRSEKLVLPPPQKKNNMVPSKCILNKVPSFTDQIATLFTYHFLMTGMIFIIVMI